MSPLRIPNEATIVHTHKTGSIIGIIFGGLISFLGIFLLLFGLTGSIDWLVNVGGISSKFINASPGIVIVVVGMIILIRYKPRVRYEYEIRKTPTTYYEKGSGAASSPITKR